MPFWHYTNFSRHVGRRITAFRFDKNNVVYRQSFLQREEWAIYSRKALAETEYVFLSIFYYLVIPFNN